MRKALKVVKLEDTRKRVEILERKVCKKKQIFFLFENSAIFSYYEMLEDKGYNTNDLIKIGIDNYIAESYGFDNCMVFEYKKGC